MQVVLELPDQIALLLGENPSAVAHRVVEDIAIENCQTGKISFRQAGQLLGLDYWETETFLKNREVPLNYTLADLEADRATLDKLFG